MASWITPRAPVSSLDRTAFRFVSIGLSVEILRRKQVSSTNRDCPHHLAVWRAKRAHSARQMASWITPRVPLSSLDRTSFGFVSIGLSVEILRRKQVRSTNRDCLHQLAVWRAERAHSARPMASWIIPRASLSSLDRTAFRFVLIRLSVEILRRKQVSSTNRDCPQQLAQWRAGSPLELLSPVSIVQLFVSSQSDFPLRFYDVNKSARRIETVCTISLCGELDHSSSFSLESPLRRFSFRLDFTIKTTKTCFFV